MNRTIALFFIFFMNATLALAVDSTTPSNNQDLKIKIVDQVTAHYNSVLVLFDRPIKSTEKTESKKYFLTQNGNLLEIDYNFTTANILGKDQLGKITVYQATKNNAGQFIRQQKVLSLLGVEIQLTDIHKIQIIENMKCDGYATLSSSADKVWTIAIGFDNGCTQNL